MKRLYFLLVVLCLEFLFTGCGTQVALSGKARDEYVKSVSIEYGNPLRKWDKPGMTPEGRRQDAFDCGGGRGVVSPESACWSSPKGCPDVSDDVPVFGKNKIKASQQPGETENATETRLRHEWQRCMLSHGYRYTGKCYDNEIGRASPACAGRVLEPLR